MTVDTLSPFVDLVGTFGQIAMPAEVIESLGGAGSISVNVSNFGNSTVAAGERIDIRISARPVTGGNAVELATLTDQLVGGIGEGQSKTFTANVTIADTLAPGNYVYEAEIDSANELGESDETNNTVAPAGALIVTEAFVDLVAAMGPSTLPAATVVGDSASGQVTANVTNLGNVPLASGQTIDIRVVARPVLGGNDVLLDTLTDQSVSSLPPGETLSYTTTVTLPATLAEGEYLIVAEIDSGLDVNESDEANNTAVSATTIIVADAFVDLQVQIGNANLPESAVAGDGTTVRLPVTVTNVGNVAVATGQKADITVFARPAGAGDDDSQDQLLDTWLCTLL